MLDPVDLATTVAEFWSDIDSTVQRLPWPPSVITGKTVTFVQDLLRKRLMQSVAAGNATLIHRLQLANIATPSLPVEDGPLDLLNDEWPQALASLVTRESLSPAQLVELVRGQTQTDYRPNKALWPDDLALLFQGYHHLDVMLDIAHHGFRIPRRAILPSQPAPPPNPGSARAFEPTLIRLMRQGQAAHQYVFLHNSVTQGWSPMLFYSPLGLVPKNKEPMSVIARVIQDLSFPIGGSVNDHTNKDDLPLICWPKIVELAVRICDLHSLYPAGSVFKGMTGDVAQAYRHLRCHADDCATFGISLPSQAMVGMDMSAPFGWNGSPNMYCVFGNGITWLVSRESPASINPCDSRRFWCYNYMDDCILMEIDEGHRLHAAELALRLAMVATL